VGQERSNPNNRHANSTGFEGRAMTAKADAISGAIVPIKLARSRTAEQRKRHARSRVSNGADILTDVDGRSLVARRFRDIASAITTDQGGADHLSEARLQLVRRFAAAAVIAEQMESDLANGKPIDVAQHALLCSSLVRIARQIGVNRIPKTIVPSLDEYLARHHTAEPVA
jgi:hypothetical protein